MQFIINDNGIIETFDEDNIGDPLETTNIATKGELAIILEGYCDSTNQIIENLQKELKISK